MQKDRGKALADKGKALAAKSGSLAPALPPSALPPSSSLPAETEAWPQKYAPQRVEEVVANPGLVGIVGCIMQCIK